MKSIMEHHAPCGKWCVEPPLAEGTAYSIVVRNEGRKPVAVADVLHCETDEATKSAAHMMALSYVMMQKLHQVSQWLTCVLDGSTDPIGNETSRRAMRGLRYDIEFIVNQTKGE